MKRLSLLLFIALFVCTSEQYAQKKIDKDETLYFDLLDPQGKFPTDFSIKRNVRVRYQIDNINRNVYAVTLNTSSRSIFSTVPEVFKVISDVDLSKLTGTTVDPGAQASATLDILQVQSTPEERARIQEFLNARSALITAFDNFDRKNKALKALTLLFQSFTATMEDGLTPFNNLFNAKLANTNAALATHFGYTGAANDEQALLNALQAASTKAFEELDKAYSDVTEKYEIYKVELPALEKAGADKLAALNKKVADLKKQKKEVTAQELTIRDIEKELNVQKVKSAGAADLINDIKSIRGKIVEAEQGGFSAKLINSYRRINRANWQYISPSIKGEKDELSVNLTIEPKEATGIITPNYAQFNGEVTGEVYGFKVNFSTGLFMLIGKDLFDRSYRVDTIAGDLENNIVVQNDRRQSVQPAVGGLMHFYNKRAGFFSWGGALGFSISNETRLNYHGGLSFLFGQEQRIIANIGVTLTRVKEISSAYTVGQKLTRSSGISTIPTEDFYRAGAFIAFTYNLSK